MLQATCHRQYLTLKPWLQALLAWWILACSANADGRLRLEFKGGVGWNLSDGEVSVPMGHVTAGLQYWILVGNPVVSDSFEFETLDHLTVLEGDLQGTTIYKSDVGEKAWKTLQLVATSEFEFEIEFVGHKNQSLVLPFTFDYSFSEGQRHADLSPGSPAWSEFLQVSHWDPVNGRQSDWFGWDPYSCTRWEMGRCIRLLEKSEAVANLKTRFGPEGYLSAPEAKQVGKLLQKFGKEQDGKVGHPRLQLHVRPVKVSWFAVDVINAFKKRRKDAKEKSQGEDPEKQAADDAAEVAPEDEATPAKVPENAFGSFFDDQPSQGEVTPGPAKTGQGSDAAKSGWDGFLEEATSGNPSVEAAGSSGGWGDLAAEAALNKLKKRYRRELASAKKRALDSCPDPGEPPPFPDEKCCKFVPQEYRDPSHTCSDFDPYFLTLSRVIPNETLEERKAREAREEAAKRRRKAREREKRRIENARCLEIFRAWKARVKPDEVAARSSKEHLACRTRIEQVYSRELAKIEAGREPNPATLR